MKLAAIVPLNSPGQTKTRLVSALPPSERAALSRWLAQRVLVALRHTHIPHIGVVSPDDEVLRWAWQNGVQPVRQEDAGLNDALDVGRAWAQGHEVDALMVILGDLPLLTSDEILAFTSLTMSTPTVPSVTIAPDRAHQGTNMLLLQPPSAIPFAFGEDSLARHIALARGTGIEPRIMQLPGAAFDVDTPADLRELIQRGLWHPSGAQSRPCAGEAS